MKKICSCYDYKQESYICILCKNIMCAHTGYSYTDNHIKSIFICRECYQSNEFYLKNLSVEYNKRINKYIDKYNKLFQCKITNYFKIKNL